MKLTLFLIVIILCCGCRASTSSKHLATSPAPLNANLQPAAQSNATTVVEKNKPVLENFKNVDFKNYQYGRYRFPTGRRINLTLDDGRHEYDLPTLDRGEFFLRDVYFADVTNDRKPEAIVVIWHVSCGVSCDGGAALIYIYAARGKTVRRLWQYETGTTAYGCGLKSLTIDNGIVGMELFGRCSIPGRENSARGKFIVEDTTRLAFRFKGKRFVRTLMKFISVPARDIKNYKAEIRIN